MLSLSAPNGVMVRFHANLWLPWLLHITRDADLGFENGAHRL